MSRNKSPVTLDEQLAWIEHLAEEKRIAESLVLGKRRELDYWMLQARRAGAKPVAIADAAGMRRESIYFAISRAISEEAVSDDDGH